MNELMIERFPTRRGGDTLQVNGYLLHSKYDPKKEADNFVENNFKENFVHVLFGYGLGYIAEALKSQNFNEQDILIIDPLKEQLNIKNEEVLNFDIEVLKDTLSKRLEFKNSEVTVICSPNYDKIAAQQYIEVLRAVKETQILERLNSNTLKSFALDWQENNIKNMIYASEDINFGEIINKFTAPIVVASGGPSLTKQLPYLKEFRDKIILIAAGSTINSLLKANIEPDFVVSVDGGIANYRHFESIGQISTTLLYSLNSQYKIQGKFPGNRIPFLPVGNQYVNELYKTSGVRLPTINGGTSVANYAFEIAQKITSGPIALIGQDLAYTNNQTHAENNKHKQKINDEYIKSNGLFEIEGYYGDIILTDYKFLSMKTYFEELLKISTHPSPIYNCTEGGIRINNFNQMTFNEFLTQYATTQVERHALQSSPIGGKEEITRVFSVILEKSKQLTSKLKSTLMLLKKEKKTYRFSSNLTSVLEKNDQLINEFFKNNHFSHILQPIIIETLSDFKEKRNETDREQFERIYFQNENLYGKLIIALEKLAIYLQEAIELAKENEHDK